MNVNTPFKTELEIMNTQRRVKQKAKELKMLIGISQNSYGIRVEGFEKWYEDIHDLEKYLDSIELVDNEYREKQLVKEERQR